MDCKLVGNLILNLRKDKNMTQRQLADLMNISDKTISKWERGLGCPDLSLIERLSQILNVNIEKLLIGNLQTNDVDIGNMNKIKFYVCQTCGGIITSTGEAEISCCGRKLDILTAKSMDDSHLVVVDNVENDIYITFSHEMEKHHFLSFFAYVLYDRVLVLSKAEKFVSLRN